MKKAEIDKLADDILIINQELGRGWLSWEAMESSPRAAYDRLLMWARDRKSKRYSK